MPRVLTPLIVVALALAGFGLAQPPVPRAAAPLTKDGYAEAKKNADALKVVSDGLTRLDGLDKLLAAAAPDQAAAQAAAKELSGATCATCHKTMREGDNQTGYKFRAEVDPFKPP